jgi:outer membrane protein
MKRSGWLLAMLFFSCNAQESTYEWGISSSLRMATIPYVTSQSDPLLNSYVLQLYLDTPALFLNGTEGGIKLFENSRWLFTAYGRQHFVDMPRHDRRYFSDDTADLGIMARYRYNSFETDLLLLSDPAWRTQAEVRLGKTFRQSNREWTPYGALAWKSAEYNGFYYGMNVQAIPADVGGEIGLKSRLFIFEDVALTAEAKIRYLGSAVAASDTIDQPVNGEVMLGAGIFQSPSIPQSHFKPKGYLRVAVGEATPSSFTENLTGKGARDLHRLYMASLFYGLPLSQSLFGADIHTYFTPGFVHHFANEPYQNPSQEYVLAFKGYYKPQAWWMRFGVGIGLSYITEPTYIEKFINEKDGYDHTSQLMHYLDFSFDVELKHILGNAWKHLWFGYALHHRSGVFESAHQYGQIKGGSNYNTLYLQLHLNNEN